MYRNRASKGFVLLEAVATCALVMITWHLITHCAVQALVLEKEVEKKANALIAATSIIEKLKAGILPLKSHIVTQQGMQIHITCEQELFAQLLQVIMVKVLIGNRELICLKTALLQQSI